MQLSPEEFATFRADFSAIDLDDSGVIDCNEIHLLLQQQLQRDPTDREVAVAVRQCIRALPSA